MSEFLLFIYRCNFGLLVIELILILSVLKLGKATNQKYKKIIKINKLVIFVIIILLLVVNIIMIFSPTTIPQGRTIGILYCLGCVFCLIAIIIDKKVIDIEGFIDFVAGLLVILGAILIIFWIFMSLLSSHGAYDGVPYHDNEKFVNKYYITEVREVPVNNVHGSSLNFQSTPGMNYYVTYKVNDGSVDTMIINGVQDSVRKYIDSKYSTNPYMEKYEIMRTYESFVPFFNYCTKKQCYRYKLYVPK